MSYWLGGIRYIWCGVHSDTVISINYGLSFSLGNVANITVIKKNVLFKLQVKRFRNCNQWAPKSTAKGVKTATILLLETLGMFEFFSPNYPNNYPNDTECERVIKGLLIFISLQIILNGTSPAPLSVLSP